MTGRETTAHDVLSGTQSALLLRGVTVTGMVPENSLVDLDDADLFVITGAEVGPGFDVTITWLPGPPEPAPTDDDTPSVRGTEVIEVDVDTSTELRVDALAGGDFLTLPIPAVPARMRISASGRPQGLADGFPGDTDPADRPVVERYRLELWPSTPPQPTLARTLTLEELGSVLDEARAAAARQRSDS